MKHLGSPYLLGVSHTCVIFSCIKDVTLIDFACGTGGFLTSALKVLDAQVDSVEDRAVYSSSVYGIEKKALPFLLCATNMLLHDIDNPRIIHGNSLEKNVRDYRESDRFDVILMNEAVICGLTPEKARNIKEFAA